MIWIENTYLFVSDMVTSVTRLIRRFILMLWETNTVFKNFFCGLTVAICLLIASVLFSIPTTATINEGDKKNILVVDSYHQGYSWSDGILSGIQSIFDDETRYNLLIERLDAKRYVDSTYFNLKEQEFRYKYGNKHIDIIILNDDNAFEFIMELRKTFLNNIPIIFAGVDHLDPESIKDIPDTYGLIGGQSIKSTLDLIMVVHPESQNIIFISDGTKAGTNMVKTVNDLEPDYKSRVIFSYLTNLSTEELLLALENLPEKSIVFSLVYIRDSHGRIYTMKESLKMISDAVEVPVYSAWGIGPDLGRLGGKVSRGYESGKMLAEIGLRILSSDNVQDIPQLQDEPSVCIYDYHVMKRFGLSVNDIPPNSIVYNLPVSTYDKYKMEIWSVITFFLLLFFYTIFLLISNIKRKKAEVALQNARDQLEQQVAERTMQLSDANRDLKAEIIERRKNEKLFVSIFELSPYPLFITRIDGEIIDVNQSFTSVFGFTKQESVGKKIQDLNIWIEFERRTQLKELLFNHKQIKNEEFKFRLKSGEIIDTQTSASLIETDEEKIILSEVINVTERKQAERALKENQKKLKESIATKDKFFSIISHDLRSPFNGILGITQILENEHQEMENEQKDMLIQMLSTNVKSTFNLLENLLSWSRAQSRTLTYKPEELNLKALLDETIIDFKALANQKEIIIKDTIANDEIVFADRNMLTTILRNLISNAIKFSNSKGHVVIKSNQNRRFCEISVSDEGIGIAQSKIDDLFLIDKDTSTLGTNNEKGTGLGLILCKEFVEKHGGKLKLESKVGKGSCFSFTVPNSLSL